MAGNVTAIIVTYDSAGVLPACLSALTREGVSAIVVDNASEDDTVAIAEAHGARIIRNAKNEGFGRANNIGIRAADTEFCLILNPDIVLDPGAVPALLAAAARYPDAGLYAPRIIEDDGRFFYQNRSFLTESVVKGRVVAGDARAHMPEGDTCAPFLSGACLLLRREDALRLGGFDPAIFLFYEDDDLCRRYLDGGQALIHVHEAVARHGRGKSSAPKPGRRYKARWHMAWSRIYIARKYALPEDSAATLRTTLPKLWLSRLLFRRDDIERYGGTVDGTRAGLAGQSAITREGLVP